VKSQSSLRGSLTIDGSRLKKSSPVKLNNGEWFRQGLRMSDWEKNQRRSRRPLLNRMVGTAVRRKKPALSLGATGSQVAYVCPAIAEVIGE